MCVCVDICLNSESFCIANNFSFGITFYIVRCTHNTKRANNANKKTTSRLLIIGIFLKQLNHWPFINLLFEKFSDRTSSGWSWWHRYSFVTIFIPSSNMIFLCFFLLFNWRLSIFKSFPFPMPYGYFSIAHFQSHHSAVVQLFGCS